MAFLNEVKADLAAHSHRTGASAVLGAFLFSPGFFLIFFHRLACLLYAYRVSRLFGRLVWRGNVLMSGCHLGLRSSIGPGFLMPHPTGIVVGDGVVIGRNVTLYQSVTLGAASKSRMEYPTIGDDVVIYPGSVIIGRVHIGDGAVVGAHSLVVSDVAPGEVVRSSATKGK